MLKDLVPYVGCFKVMQGGFLYKGVDFQMPLGFRSIPSEVNLRNYNNLEKSQGPLVPFSFIAKLAQMQLALIEEGEDLWVLHPEGEVYRVPWSNTGMPGRLEARLELSTTYSQVLLENLLKIQGSFLTRVPEEYPLTLQGVLDLSPIRDALGASVGGRYQTSITETEVGVSAMLPVGSKLLQLDDADQFRLEEQMRNALSTVLENFE